MDSFIGLSRCKVLYLTSFHLPKKWYLMKINVSISLLLLWRGNICYFGYSNRTVTNRQQWILLTILNGQWSREWVFLDDCNYHYLLVSNIVNNQSEPSFIILGLFFHEKLNLFISTERSNIFKATAQLEDEIFQLGLDLGTWWCSYEYFLRNFGRVSLTLNEGRFNCHAFKKILQKLAWRYALSF